MKANTKFSLAILGLVLSSTLLFSNSILAKPATLKISTLSAPIPVPTSDKNLLVYELHFVNSADLPKQLDRIEVRDEYNKLLTSYAGNKLMRNQFIYRDGKKVEGSSINLSKDMGVFVYMWVALNKKQALPTRLHHKIWLVSTDSSKDHADLDTINYELAVKHEKLPVLGAPLEGYHWSAAAAVSPTSYHRRTILPFDGKFYLAQRYAIDWEQICPDGRAVHGDVHNNQNWSSFGHKILAVADGEIANLSDEVSQNNTPPQFPNPPSKNVLGNYVILKIKQHGKNYFVFYGHMQPGSIRVNKGDKVTRGQVLGLLGNTGNSSAPHLHLHVTSTNEALKSDGIPYVFDQISLEGRGGQINADYGFWVLPVGPLQKFTRILPSKDQFIQFSEKNVMNCKPYSGSENRKEAP